ncbi:TlpA family protein disulfide reductase [Urechidicola sp. KH5]
MKIKQLLYFGVFMLILASCSTAQEGHSATYFGGHIKNPKNSFITLSKNDVVIDTMYLDNENNFITQLDTHTHGLYMFNHGLEYQYVYFEPRDSILIHLNTWDFDESLVFSGKGAQKNNFLIGLYLQNEKEEHEISPYYNQVPFRFEEKIQSNISLNNFLYQQMLESGTEVSEEFDELAQVAINYPMYKLLESYPYIHKSRFQLEDYPELSATYYDFRQGIDMNNEQLIDFAPYYSYINIYIHALARSDKDKHENTSVAILNTIDKHIEVERFKNTLLRQVVYGNFRNKPGACSIDIEVLETFNALCSNNKMKEQINALAEDCEKIVHNKSLDNFEIIDVNNNTLRINKVVKNKNTVIYFWSPELISPDMLIKRVKYLEKKYPDLMFVGINLEPTEFSNLKLNNTLKHQYFLTEDSSAHGFVKSLEPRTILIDRNGKVTNSFTYLSSPYLERQLTVLIKN